MFTEHNYSHMDFVDRQKEQQRLKELLHRDSPQFELL